MGCAAGLLRRNSAPTGGLRLHASGQAQETGTSSLCRCLMPGVSPSCRCKDHGSSPKQTMGAKTTIDHVAPLPRVTWSIFFGPDSLTAGVQLRTALMDGISQHFYAVSRPLNLEGTQGCRPPGSAHRYGVCEQLQRLIEHCRSGTHTESIGC